jgi:hypothetical protein
MKASEILRGLADLLTNLEQGGEQDMTSKYTPDTQEPTGVDQAGTFVPPLQAKIELLKKAVDVDSIYDQTGPDEDLTGQGADNEDELVRMRKMAGINPVVADEAASDEPLDI